MNEKKEMRDTVLRLILLFLFVLLGATSGYTQTATGLEDKLILRHDRNFLICSEEGKQFRTNVYNDSDMAYFRDGTFEIDLGNGTAALTGLSKLEFPYTVTYYTVGQYELKFSALSNDGIKVTKVYNVRTLGRPKINLQKQDNNTKCINSDISYVVDVYNQNTSGTKYTLDYDDNSSVDIKTNDELKASGGLFTHKYDHSYCDELHAGSSNEAFVLKLKVTNECGYTENTTIDEFVVRPLNAKFTFQKLVNCTSQPVEIQNLTTGGGNSNCGYDEIFYDWTFGNGKTSTLRDPVITYEEAKKYPIRLITSNQYACAADTTYGDVEIIKKITADFEIAKDTLCTGTTLKFINKSQGSAMRSYWSLLSQEGFAAPDISGTHPEVVFDHYGKFDVSLHVTNGCSDDRKDTVIVVRQDPGITQFALPSTICPPRFDLSSYVRYEWFGNPEKPEWTINPATGWSFVESTGKNSLYPKIDFTVAGHYTVSVKLKGVGCGGTILEKSAGIVVYDPTVVMNVTSTPVIPARPEVLNICEKGQISFTSASTGEGILHSWSVSPSFEVEKNGLDTRNPLFKFNKYGDYEVKMQLSTACGFRDSIFNIRVKKEPGISFFEPKAAVCPDEVIDFNSCLIYQWYNNTPQAQWTITPAAGYEFLEGTGLQSPLPKIKFKTPGTYTFRVELTPVGCGESGGVVQSMTKTIKVRNSAMTMRLTATDTAVCEGGVLDFTCDARAAEDDPLLYTWSVTPSEDLYTEFKNPPGLGKSVATLLFKQWGTYQIRGEVAGYCGTLDSTIRIVVKKDPEIYLKDTAVCPGVLDLQEYATYIPYNNKKAIQWTVAPTVGYEGDLTQLYPKIHFKDKGRYVVKAQLTTAGCSETHLQTQSTYTIHDTTIKVDVNPDRRDICEGEKVRFRNMSSGVGLSYFWSVSGPEGSCMFAENTDATTMAPVLLFSKYGEYEVLLVIEGTCNRKEVSFKITVRGVPEMTLAAKMEKICVGGEAVDMKRYLDVKDKKNNELTYQWMISPNNGFEYVSGFDATTEYPQIKFNENNHYDVILTVNSRCVAVPQIMATKIDVLRNTLGAVFNIPAEGCTDNLETLVLNNTSTGDSLNYTWSITPAEGWQYKTGYGMNDRSPKVAISSQGVYTVRLQVDNICGEDNSVFSIRTYSRPEVFAGDITNVCETYTLVTKDTIRIKENNDAIVRAKWSIDKPVDFTPGFTHEDFYPEMLLNAGVYRITAQYWNGCDMPGEVVFHVDVDRFIPIDPLLNDTLCLFEPALSLAANPAGGTWALSGPTGMLEDVSGNWNFKPLYSGDYNLVYSKSNGSCVATRIKKMRVHPLPIVTAGDDPAMCLNIPSMELTATPVGGRWRGDGVQNDHFIPTTIGDFSLYYTYTDENQCTNDDTVVMTVHPLPLPGFTTPLQHCLYAEALFTVEQAEGNTFEWDFGDGQPRETSTGNIFHVYQSHGDRRVSNITTSGDGCVVKSDTMDLEVVNLPPPAIFTVNKSVGCAPFETEITVDKGNYTDKNLHFAWDYGDGVITDTLGAIRPKIYMPGVWDTTYVAHFQVGNRCDTTHYYHSFTVGSLPQASFKLMHKWECTPVDVVLKNTTTGNNSTFTWNFGDGTPEDSEMDQLHTYTTGKKATTYDITLISQNSCGEDQHTRSLMVKPRTVAAHFSPDKPLACVGEKICFGNNSTDTSTTIVNTYWNFGDGARDSTWDACHVYASGGKFRVELLIDNGCGEHSIGDSVTIYSLPELVIKSEPYLCETDTFTFVLQTDSILKHIEWNFGDGHTDGRDSLRYAYAGYGNYTVQVEGIAATPASCYSKVSKDIVIYNKPIVSVLPMDTMACSPFFYKPDTTGTAFLMWDFGDGSAQTSSGGHGYENFSDTVQKFKVTVCAETDRGCKSDYTRNVTIYNLPRAGIEKVVTKGRPEKVEFVNLSEKNTDCIWQLPTDTLHSLGNQTLTFSENGHYPVTLIAVNHYGCRDTMSIEHEVLLKGLFFPNTFIPHSTNSRINLFNGIGMGLEEYHLEISDQYGNKIWETNALSDGKPTGGWDGCSLDGKVLPQGIYTWRASAVFVDAEVWVGKNNSGKREQTTQGTVLLLRK